MNKVYKSLWTIIPHCNVERGINKSIFIQGVYSILLHRHRDTESSWKETVSYCHSMHLIKTCLSSNSLGHQTEPSSASVKVNHGEQMDIGVHGELRLDPAGTRDKQFVVLKLICGQQQDESNICFALITHFSPYVTCEVYRR